VVHPASEPTPTTRRRKGVPSWRYPDANHQTRRASRLDAEIVYWWWLVFAGLLPGLRFLVRHRFNDVVPLLVMILGFGLLYSVMFMNVGLIYRQRAQLMPWLLMFAAVGLEHRRQRRSARLAARSSRPARLDGSDRVVPA
jgi:hypothetical protein